MARRHRGDAGWLFLYDLAWLPAAMARAAIETLANPCGAPRSLAERLGWVGSSPESANPTIWFHAVSVGELLSIAPVLERLHRARPTWRCVISVGNVPARRLAEARFCPRLADRVFLLPWDMGALVRRAVARVRPTLFVIVECELWPNLIVQVTRTSCALIAINARIYDRDYRRYRAAARLFGPWLRRFAAIAARSPLEAERFRALGADPSTIYVGGSSKPDAALEARTDGDLPWRALMGDGPMWVLASTHPGEEDAVLARAATLYQAHPRLRLVVVPRDPRRAQGLVAAFSRAGYRARPLALATTDGTTDVLVVDRLGELASAVRAADLVFIGGTLAPRGGQTPLEAAAAARAILVGPSRAHFAAESARLAEAAAWVEVEDADALVHAAVRLLADSEARADLGRRARAVVEAEAGVASRLAERVVALVEGVTRHRVGLVH